MRFLVVLVALILLSGCTVQFNTGDEQDKPVRGGTQQEQKDVRLTAEEILGKLDRGDWQNAWSGSASSLKSTASLPQFIAGVQSTRVAFGAPISRSVKGFNFTESIDGAPPGRYAIVFFNTAFSGAGEVEEHLVLSHEDGQWLLAGYWAEREKRFSTQ